MAEGSLYALRSINLHFFQGGEDTVTFYVIGGSTSYGVPFDDSPSFVRLIEDKLQGKYQGLKIKTEMIAFGGKTLISNVFDFVKCLFLRPSKNAVVLACVGINEDVLGEYKYKKKLHLENILNKSVVGLIIYNFFYELFKIDPNKDGRNSNFLYESRLQTLVDFARGMGHPVYLSELTSNFHGHASVPHFNIPPLLFKKLVGCYLNKKGQGRIDCFENFSGNLKDSYYIKHVIMREKYFLNPLEKSIQKELLLTTDQAISKNISLRKIAKHNKSVTFVPLIEEFRKKGGGFFGFNLFFDICHPRLDGMTVIANQFLRALTGNKKMGVWPLKKIREKYQLYSKKYAHDTILRSVLANFFLMMISKSPLGFYYNFESDFKKMGRYFPRDEAILRYLIHPFLPFLVPSPNTKSLENSWKGEGFETLYNYATVSFLNEIRGRFKNHYISILKRSREAFFISEKSYQQYLAFLTLKATSR